MNFIMRLTGAMNGPSQVLPDDLHDVLNLGIVFVLALVGEEQRVAHGQMGVNHPDIPCIRRLQQIGGNHRDLAASDTELWR